MFFISWSNGYTRHMVERGKSHISKFIDYFTKKKVYRLKLKLNRGLKFSIFVMLYLFLCFVVKVNMKKLTWIKLKGTKNMVNKTDFPFISVWKMKKKQID